MNLNDLFNEEKVRLDPKCWTGKKIGNPKTKMKGGTRVNNCVPAESVNEMDKSQTPPGRDGSNDSDAGKKEYTAKPTTAKKVAKDAEKVLNKELNKKQGVAEGSNGEYDDEAGMAQGNLYTIAKAAKGLLDTIDDRDNLPEWVQEKIAKVEGMLVTSWNYMQSQKAQGIDPQITESICSLTEAEEIFNDFERSVQERGLSEDIYDTITDDEIIAETAAWRRKEGKSKKGGLNAKGVASYRRENPGSKLQMAVTTKPSKLKKGSKAAKRRKSFCARMSGVKGPMKKPNGKPTRKALALRKWNC